MLPEELSALIETITKTKCEHQHIELKAARQDAPRRLYDTLSSFSNQKDGGVIIFGIDENDNYALKGVYDPQDLQVKVTNQANEMVPVVRPVFTVAQVDGKSFVSAEILECSVYDKPCFYRAAGRLRGSYIRVGEADERMTEYEIYSYEAFKRDSQDELAIVEKARTEDFDKRLIAEYMAKIQIYKPNLANQTEEKILKLQGMTSEGKPTVAGLMLFGEYPQGFFPQLSIIAMLVDDSGDLSGQARNERFIDNQRIEGTLSQMLKAALAFIRRNTRSATILDRDGKREDRPEYPMLAVREIILNALIHRDYSIYTTHAPIRIQIFTDRLVVENPGGLYGRLTVEDLGKAVADTRNPFIAGAMETLGLAENRFSGIPAIAEEMRAAGLPPAQFESFRGTFKVTLRNSTVKETAPAGAKDSLPDPLPKDEALLLFCETPRSRREIAEFLGIGTSYYAQRKYLQPLLEAGKIKMTLPSAPRSKNQRFKTV